MCRSNCKPSKTLEGAEGPRFEPGLFAIIWGLFPGGKRLEHRNSCIPNGQDREAGNFRCAEL